MLPGLMAGLVGGGPVQLNTANLVAAWKASDATVTSGYVDSVSADHGTSITLSSSGTNRPEYFATAGPDGGPAIGFGTESAQPDCGLDISAALRSSAGSMTFAMVINPQDITTEQQFLIDCQGTGGRMHVNSLTDSASKLVGLRDNSGGYKSTGAATTGWQLLIWHADDAGDQLEVFRGDTSIGTATFDGGSAGWNGTGKRIGCIYSNFTLGNFHGLLERIFAFDAAISAGQRDNIRAFVFQELGL